MILLNENMRNITKNKNSYTIRKSINGKTINFGRYSALEEAIKVRDALIEVNWNEELLADELKNLKLKNNKNMGTYIYKINNKYRIEKSIKSKNKTFGHYKTFEEAIKVRDALIEVNWEENKLPFKIKRNRKWYQYGKHIKKVNDYYAVYRYINGKSETFGHFRTLEEAKKKRDEVIAKNWDLSLRIKTKKNRYIYKTDNDYKIYKRIDGKVEYFGSYKTFEEAIAARKNLENNNWYINQETDENTIEKFDEYIYCVGNNYFIKKDINSKTIAEFDNFNEAIDFRNYCIRHNWDKTKLKEKYGDL